MLKLYTKNNLPQKELIAVPWLKYYNDNQITKYLDKSDEKIIENVESASLANNTTIYSKFSSMPIEIGCLSEGCKTLLCINHAIKNNTVQNYIFNLTSCGGNAVSYVASVITKEKDVCAYINHSEFGMSTTCNIMINNSDVIYTDAIKAAIEYTKQRSEYAWIN